MSRTTRHEKYLLDSGIQQVTFALNIPVDLLHSRHFRLEKVGFVTY